MLRASRILAMTPLVVALLSCDGRGGATEFIPEPPPTFVLTGRSPHAGAEGVPQSASLVLTFNSDLDPATVEQGVISANGATLGTLHVRGRDLIFTPLGGWIPGSSYAIAISPDLAGINGKALGPVAVWGFKTAGIAPNPDTLSLTRARPR